MRGRFVLIACALFAFPAACGGRASEKSENAASGGTGGIAGSAGSGGEAGAGESHDEFCDTLLLDAQNGFFNGYLAEHRACQVDSDCVFHPGMDCVSYCGFAMDPSAYEGLDAAVDQACANFRAERCVMLRLPCLEDLMVHLPVTCEAGVCKGTPPTYPD